MLTTRPPLLGSIGRSNAPEEVPRTDSLTDEKCDGGRQNAWHIRVAVLVSN
jgi:hypothetical protein